MLPTSIAPTATIAIGDPVEDRSTVMTERLFSQNTSKVPGCSGPRSQHSFFWKGLGAPSLLQVKHPIILTTREIFCNTKKEIREHEPH